MAEHCEGVHKAGVSTQPGQSVGVKLKDTRQSPSSKPRGRHGSGRLMDMDMDMDKTRGKAGGTSLKKAVAHRR